MDRLGGFFGFRDREEDFDDDYVEEDDTDLIRDIMEVRFNPILIRFNPT